MRLYHTEWLLKFDLKLAITPMNLYFGYSSYMAETGALNRVNQLQLRVLHKFIVSIISSSPFQHQSRQLITPSEHVKVFTYPWINFPTNFAI